MKKRFFFVLFLWLNIITITAQTSYYTQTKTFYESDYTYQCDVSLSQTVTLYNKSNQLTYEDVIYKSTGELYFPKARADFMTFEDETWTKKLCHNIVDNAFSASERSRVKGEELLTTLYISPETGKVVEVNFMFQSYNPFATIPLSVYRQIEVELKSKIWFTITPQGKKLNYIMLCWGQEIYPPSTPPAPLPYPDAVTPSWNGDMAMYLDSFSPMPGYGGNTKYTYPDMFNYTDDWEDDEANIYISGTGFAMMTFHFINQSKKDIKIEPSRFRILLKRDDGSSFYAHIIDVYSGDSSTSIKNEIRIIPSKGGVDCFGFGLNLVLGEAWEVKPHDFRMYLMYDNKYVMTRLIDDRYHWDLEDKVIGTWYPRNYIMFRYIYNPLRCNMYYNRTTREYFY